ncbi:golgin subfamily B member 1-like [Echeneis naucrates]|uniref:golgin subfamily B member 1-like n=1 Tax=Echeneis naucrates TaxID=173247 RepID=UPI001113FC31|nr:golgin subfamily B member 1-like [Echeneis naucrates]
MEANSAEQHPRPTKMLHALRLALIDSKRENEKLTEEIAALKEKFSTNENSWEEEKMAFIKERDFIASKLNITQKSLDDLMENFDIVKTSEKQMQNKHEAVAKTLKKTEDQVLLLEEQLRKTKTEAEQIQDQMKVEREIEISALKETIAIKENSWEKEKMAFIKESDFISSKLNITQKSLDNLVENFDIVKTSEKQMQNKHEAVAKTLKKTEDQVLLLEEQLRKTKTEAEEQLRKTKTEAEQIQDQMKVEREIEISALKETIAINENSWEEEKMAFIKESDFISSKLNITQKSLDDLMENFDIVKTSEKQMQNKHEAVAKTLKKTEDQVLLLEEQLRKTKTEAEQIQDQMKVEREIEISALKETIAIKENRWEKEKMAFIKERDFISSMLNITQKCLDDLMENFDIVKTSEKQMQNKHEAVAKTLKKTEDQVLLLEEQLCKTKTEAEQIQDQMKVEREIEISALKETIAIQENNWEEEKMALIKERYFISSKLNITQKSLDDLMENFDIVKTSEKQMQNKHEAVAKTLKKTEDQVLLLEEQLRKTKTEAEEQLRKTKTEAEQIQDQMKVEREIEISALKETIAIKENNWEEEKMALIKERYFISSKLNITQKSLDDLMENFDIAKAREKQMQNKHEAVAKMLKQTEDQVLLLEEQLRKTKTEAEQIQDQMKVEREIEISALKETIAINENSWEEEKMALIKERDFIASKLNITQKSLDDLVENFDIVKTSEKQMQNKHEAVAKTLKKTEDQVLLLEEQLRKTKTEAEQIQDQMKVEREIEISALKETIAIKENNWEEEKMALIKERYFISSKLNITQKSLDDLMENFDIAKAREKQMQNKHEAVAKMLKQTEDQVLLLEEQLRKTKTEAEQIQDQMKVEREIEISALKETIAIKENSWEEEKMALAKWKDFIFSTLDYFMNYIETLKAREKRLNTNFEVVTKQLEEEHERCIKLAEELSETRIDAEVQQYIKADMEERWLAKEEDWKKRTNAMEEHIYHLTMLNIKLHRKMKAKKEARERLMNEMKEQKKREKKDNNCFSRSKELVLYKYQRNTLSPPNHTQQVHYRQKKFFTRTRQKKFFTRTRQKKFVTTTRQSFSLPPNVGTTFTITPQPVDLCSSTMEANSAEQHPRPTKMLHALRLALIDSKRENEKLTEEIAALKEKFSTKENSGEKEKEFIKERDFISSKLNVTQKSLDDLMENFDIAKAREKQMQNKHEAVEKMLKQTEDQVLLLEEQLRKTKTEAEEQLRKTKTEAEQIQDQMKVEREIEISALKETIAIKENNWEEEKMALIKERYFISSKLNITQKSLDDLMENFDIAKASEKQMQNKHEAVAKTLKKTEDQVLLLEEQLRKTKTEAEEQLRKTKTEAEQIQDQMKLEREIEISALKETIAIKENNWEEEKMALIKERYFISSKLNITQKSLDDLMENFDIAKAREKQMQNKHEAVAKMLKQTEDQVLLLEEQLRKTKTEAEQIQDQMKVEREIEISALKETIAINENSWEEEKMALIKERDFIASKLNITQKSLDDLVENFDIVKTSEKQMQNKHEAVAKTLKKTEDQVLLLEEQLCKTKTEAEQIQDQMKVEREIEISALKETIAIQENNWEEEKMALIKERYFISSKLNITQKSLDDLMENFDIVKTSEKQMQNKHEAVAKTLKKTEDQVLLLEEQLRKTKTEAEEQLRKTKTEAEQIQDQMKVEREIEISALKETIAIKENNWEEEKMALIKERYFISSKLNITQKSLDDLMENFDIAKAREKQMQNKHEAVAKMLKQTEDQVLLLEEQLRKTKTEAEQIQDQMKVEREIEISALKETIAINENSWEEEKMALIKERDFIASKLNITQKSLDDLVENFDIVKTSEKQMQNKHEAVAKTLKKTEDQVLLLEEQLRKTKTEAEEQLRKTKTEAEQIQDQMKVEREIEISALKETIAINENSWEKEKMAFIKESDFIASKLNITQKSLDDLMENFDIVKTSEKQMQNKHEAVAKTLKKTEDQVLLLEEQLCKTKTEAEQIQDQMKVEREIEISALKETIAIQENNWEEEKMALIKERYFISSKLNITQKSLDDLMENFDIVKTSEKQMQNKHEAVAKTLKKTEDQVLLLEEQLRKTKTEAEEQLRKTKTEAEQIQDQMKLEREIEISALKETIAIKENNWEEEKMALIKERYFISSKLNITQKSLDDLMENFDIAKAREKQMQNKHEAVAKMLKQTEDQVLLLEEQLRKTKTEAEQIQDQMKVEREIEISALKETIAINENSWEEEKMALIKERDFIASKLNITQKSLDDLVENFDIVKTSEKQMQNKHEAVAKTLKKTEDQVLLLEEQLRKTKTEAEEQLRKTKTEAEQIQDQMKVEREIEISALKETIAINENSWEKEKMAFIKESDFIASKLNITQKSLDDLMENFDIVKTSEKQMQNKHEAVAKTLKKTEDQVLLLEEQLCKTKTEAEQIQDQMKVEREIEISALKETIAIQENNWEEEKMALIKERYFISSKLNITQKSLDDLMENFDIVKTSEKQMQNKHEAVAKTLKKTEDQVLLLEEQLRKTKTEAEEQLRKTKTEAEQIQDQMKVEREIEISALKETIAIKENNWEEEKMALIKERYFISSKLNITQKSLDDLMENFDIAKASEKQMQNKHEAVAKTLKKTEDQVLLLEEQLRKTKTEAEEQLRKTKTEAEQIQDQMKVEREIEISALKETIAIKENNWEEEKMALIKERYFISSKLNITQKSLDDLMENFDIAKAREKQMQNKHEAVAKMLKQTEDQVLLLEEQLRKTKTEAEQIQDQMKVEREIEISALKETIAINENSWEEEKMALIKERDFIASKLNITQKSLDDLVENFDIVKTSEKQMQNKHEAVAKTLKKTEDQVLLLEEQLRKTKTEAEQIQDQMKVEREIEISALKETIAIKENSWEEEKMALAKWKDFIFSTLDYFMNYIETLKAREKRLNTNFEVVTKQLEEEHERCIKLAEELSETRIDAEVQQYIKADMEERWLAKEEDWKKRTNAMEEHIYHLTMLNIKLHRL